MGMNHPNDETIIGSGAVGRNTEWQINNATIGIDTNDFYILTDVRFSGAAL